MGDFWQISLKGYLFFKKKKKNAWKENVTFLKSDEKILVY